MLTKPKYQIFISSPYKDLKNCRQRVSMALLKNNCIPVGMEVIPAISSTTWSVIKSSIDSSDLYILLLAGKYGSYCPEELCESVLGERLQISYTELEYRYAEKQNIPVLVFLHENPSRLPETKRETDAEKVNKLDCFRAYLSNKWCAYWKSPSDLVSEVSAAVSNQITSGNLIGWTRLSNHLSNQNKLFEQLSLAGIVGVYEGRHELQANQYDIESILSSLSNNDTVIVLARSARAFGDQYRRIQSLMSSKCVEFTFLLGNPNIPTYDTWGKADLEYVLSLFEAGIADKSNLKVFLLPFYSTFSLTFFTNKDKEKCIIDLFVDLPYERRHTIVLEGDDTNDYFLLSACKEIINEYQSMGELVDFATTSYNLKTKVIVSP
jgi:hypothetical protein